MKTKPTQTSIAFKTFLTLITFLTLTTFSAFAQGGVVISTNPDTTADPSAILDVQDTTRGVLIPRMTTEQRNQIQNPAIGLQIFNTTTESFEYYTSEGWKSYNRIVPYGLVLKWKVTDDSVVTDIDLGLDSTNAKYILASVFLYCDADDHTNTIFGYNIPDQISWATEYYDYNDTSPNTYVVSTFMGDNGGYDYYGRHYFLIIPLKPNHRMDAILAHGANSSGNTHYIKLRIIAYIE